MSNDILAVACRTLACVLLAVVPGSPCLAAAPDTHAPAGFALVIGEDLYDGVPRHTSCKQTAHDAANRLREAGMVTEALSNPTTIGLRDALDNFAAQLNGAPSGATLIYVCSTALADHERLFILPSDVALDQPVQPETQGVVMQALVNTLTGTGGTLFADLEMLHGGRVESGAALLRERLPPGLHVAISAGRDSHVGVLGEAISGGRISAGADKDWKAVVAGIATLPAPSGTLLTLPPSSAPQPALVQAPVAPQDPQPGSRPQAAAAVPPVLRPLSAQAAPLRPGAQPRTEQTYVGQVGNGKADAPTQTVTAKALPPPRTGPGTAPVVPVQVAPLPGSPKPASTTSSPTYGVETAQALPRPVPSPHASPRQATRTDRIARLQSAMLAQGVYAGPLNGVMNERTRAAIRQWQGRMGDARTGALTQMEVVRLLDGGEGSR